MTITLVITKIFESPDSHESALRNLIFDNLVGETLIEFSFEIVSFTNGEKLFAGMTNPASSA